jgi:hypothetical protein
MNVPKTPNNLGTFYTNLGKTANQQLSNITKNASLQFNSLGKTATNHLANIASKTNESVQGVSNSLRNIAVNSFVPASSANKGINYFSGLSTSTNVKSAINPYAWPLVIFIIIAVLCIVIYVKYRVQISAGINNIIQKIRAALNQPTTPLINASTKPITNVTDSPIPPQDERTKHKTKGLFSKLLPNGSPEVFNVSKNDFPYYDAEPLCRALGAELATYDQVKEAWSKGADWCNYGWVKGQAAVYPIQEETWKRVQAGPEENRGSCGMVGLNGGYFENPELKFGVNCYGVKPLQSEHDEEVLMRQGSIPQSAPSLEVEKKVQEFKKIADNLGVLPFNNEKWHD